MILLKLLSEVSHLVLLSINVFLFCFFQMSTGVLFLQEGKVEAEEFTEQLYQELKSTPQPCLVPFLKVPQQRQLKHLAAVYHYLLMLLLKREHITLGIPTRFFCWARLAYLTLSFLLILSRKVFLLSVTWLQTPTHLSSRRLLSPPPAAGWPSPTLRKAPAPVSRSANTHPSRHFTTHPFKIISKKV